MKSRGSSSPLLPPSARNVMQRVALGALAAIVIAMQWFAANHRAGHALHDTSAALFMEHAAAFVATQSARTDTAAGDHSSHDPFAHHEDNAACVLFDAALSVTPVSAASNGAALDVETRERSVAPALPALASRALRTRVRDPPALA
jgi:hypothetical protein